MLYLLLKWLHVLAAIVAFGADVTYGIWIARASRKPEALEGFQSPHYQALARRGTMIGAVLAFLVIVIVYWMVVKPGLWG
jgi:type II secretory pathway component PulM